MVLDDDLFGSDNGDVEVVNLTGADRPDAASQEDEKVAVAPTPAPSSKVKLAAYQCAICMDDVTNLMVTHCGACFLVSPSQQRACALSLSPHLDRR